jgi:TrmH family RNA methyltransferase
MGADSVIRSREHPLIKRVGAVRAGREPSLVVLEGDRLIDDAIGAGFALDVVLVAEDRADRADLLERWGQEVKIVERALMKRISALTSSPGTMALCSTPKPIDIAEVAFTHDSLVLVVAGVADPGNVGALARCAEAFGARAIFFARGGASPWNEKALRGSMGSLLRVPVSHGASAETIAHELASRGVRQVIAATRGGNDPRAFDWDGPMALWVTNETGALPPVASTFEKLTIPMAGRAESLNVTVAAALLLFASGRAHRSKADESSARTPTRFDAIAEKQRSSSPTGGERTSARPKGKRRG